MKCVSLALVLLCVLFILSRNIQAQVSFFQPPTFTDCSPVTFANLFVADFNGDGKPDLLCSDGTLSLGNGDGTFKLGTPLSLNNSQGIAAVADFNGDGRPDVLETGSSGTLLVLLGNGDGTFQAPVSSVGVIFQPVAAVDLNGDGKADVVGIYAGNPNGTLNVCISNGDGTFKPGVPYSLGSTGYASSVSAGDFNGDGKIDVVVYTATQVLVFLGNGDGTLQSPKTSVGPSYNSSDGLFYVVAADFNGDGGLDLAIGAGCGSQGCDAGPVYTLLGNGDGTFQAPQSTIANSGPFVAVDVNGDGKLDLVDAGSPTVAQIYLGNGDGTFSVSRSYVATLSPASAYTATTIAAGDFNSDGKVDIATAGGVLLGNGDGTFQGIPLSSGVGANVIGDFEKNGKPDVAMVSPGTVYVAHNNGDGTLSLTHTYSVPESTIVAGDLCLVTGDVNGDGNLDLVVMGENATSNEFEYSVLLGNGDGSFQTPISYMPGLGGNGASVAAIADLNNDHKLDLLMLGYNLVVLLGNGDGTFAAPAIYYPGGDNPGGSAPLLLGDFNGDGNLDVATSDVAPAAGTVVLYGKGDGTFQPAVVPTDLNGFFAYLAADLRNNGRVDLVGSSSTNIYGQVALNNGDGTFTFLPALPNGPVAIADVNGDGKPDLFVGLASNQTCPIGVQLGEGDGTFGTPINLGCLPYPLSRLIADMNGDGRPDLVFNWIGGIAVLLNTTPPGFSLSATALSPGTVIAGSSATSTVSVAPTFGFAGAVTLSCVGLPSGASCAFNPPSIAKSLGTSALTITTTTSLATGTYPMQIQGTAGSTVNSAAVSLVVQAAPDFSIGAASGSPTSQSISAGQTASFSVAFASTGGFTGTVNLSCAITPAVTPAPTCSLPASVQIGGSGTQTVTAKVGTTAPVASVDVPQVNYPLGPMPLAWTLMLLGSAWLSVRNRRRLSALAGPIVVLALAFSVGCGGSGSSSTSQTTPGTPAGTYTATITATSGSTSHNMVLKVVVQ